MHFWIVAKYIERNPIKAKMIKSVSGYRYQSFFQWKFKKEYYPLIEKSKIFEMTLKEYKEYISTEMPSDISDTVFNAPKLVTKNGELKILQRRLETFFEYDRDINRNANINKAYEYVYSKADIVNFLNISNTAISKIVEKL
jgi:hypothetical protein